MPHKRSLLLAGMILVAMGLALWCGYIVLVNQVGDKQANRDEKRAGSHPSTLTSHLTPTERRAEVKRSSVAADRGARDEHKTRLPPGFRMERVVLPPAQDRVFSLINLTFDHKGRLFVSRENGPVLLCTHADRHGRLQVVQPYCEQIKNCHGMCWAEGALFLVGDGPDGLGLYRVRDTTGADKIDEVKLLHRFSSNDPERGPHAVLHGPDGWLYVVVGYQKQPVGQSTADPGQKQGRGGSDGLSAPAADTLLPQMESPFDPAAGVVAPGGTIWRFEHDGKNMSLVAAGLRNAFDAAFSPAGELFTFDGDMETEAGLPWYRPVRIYHCTPGADFVYRSGTANTPDYYIDSLPAALDVGRGCPVGMEFYDHVMFPPRYRGVCFMADWSGGLIYAVRLERRGASYAAKLESFCQNIPERVTDVAVGPDGALYFATGGRGHEGGVYRIVYENRLGEPLAPQDIETVLAYPQPDSAWGRAACQGVANLSTASRQLAAIARDANRPLRDRLRALDLLARGSDRGALIKALLPLADVSDAEVRAHVIMLLGYQPAEQARDALIRSLRDDDALVRRRSCEALLRAGFVPPVHTLWPLLKEHDRFVRTAARLVLQRIDPREWSDRLENEENFLSVCEAIVALCKTNQLASYTERVFARLHREGTGLLAEMEAELLLGYLRTLQLALIHARPRAVSEGDKTTRAATEPSPRTPADWSTATRQRIEAISERCYQLFPHADWRVNRELAILLTYFRRAGFTNKPVHARLLGELRKTENGKQRAESQHEKVSSRELSASGSPHLSVTCRRAQQIHYFLCLRLLHDGWTKAQMDELLSWYHQARSWPGSHKLFLRKMLDDAKPVFTRELPESPAELANRYVELLASEQGSAVIWRELLLEKLTGSTQDGVEPALRLIADRDPAQKDVVARSLARYPMVANWTYLVKGLDSADPVVVFEVIEALRQIPARPHPDDASTYRNLILSHKTLNDKNRWKVVELLRHWENGKQFGASPGDWRSELASWSKWFMETFPHEPALPGEPIDRPPASKFAFDELLTYLEKHRQARSKLEQQQDVEQGRVVFARAQCSKCHQYRSVGEGIGPDLSTLANRMRRTDVLKKLFWPSTSINDRYRSTLIVTKKGLQVQGLAVPRGNTVEVLQSDGSKIVLHREEIEQQSASPVSVMPPNLLEPLTRQEIAALFAFLGLTDPANGPTGHER